MEKPVQSNENARLHALAAYEILDTAPEQSYDDLTALAAFICDCPIALVSLVDEHRQWFKSRQGLEATETPRAASFCSQAIAQTQPLVVPDAALDPRFADSPLVAGHTAIRFYAGVPLINPEGHALGALCVWDREPRTLDARRLQTLEALARQVSALLELRRISARLADTLHRLKVLEGLLPICAYCKRVRDDTGRWHQVESYVKANSGADFTHGICPTCVNGNAPNPGLVFRS